MKIRPEFVVVEWRDLDDGAGEGNLPAPTAPTASVQAIEHKPAPVEHCAKEQAPPWKSAKPVEPTEIEAAEAGAYSRRVDKIGKPRKMPGKPVEPVDLAEEMNDEIPL